MCQVLAAARGEGGPSRFVTETEKRHSPSMRRLLAFWRLPLASIRIPRQADYSTCYCMPVRGNVNWPPPVATAGPLVIDAPTGIPSRTDPHPADLVRGKGNRGNWSAGPAQHAFGKIKPRINPGYIPTRGLNCVETEMSLTALAHTVNPRINLLRVPEMVSALDCRGQARVRALALLVSVPPPHESSIPGSLMRSRIVRWI